MGDKKYFSDYFSVNDPQVVQDKGKIEFIISDVIGLASQSVI